MRSFFFGLCIVLGLALMITSSANKPRAALAKSEADTPTNQAAYPTIDDRYRRAPLTVDTTPKPETEAVYESAQPTPTEVEAAPTEQPVAITPPATEEPTPVEVAVDEPVAETYEPAVEVTEESVELPAIIAKAGDPLDVWAGLNTLSLDASASTGEGLSYSWQQLSGPTLEIDDTTAATPTISGLLANATAWEPITYEFIVTITDQFGQQHSDKVSVVSRGAPDLALVPNVPQERYWTTQTFDNYEDKTVPHFEVHASAPLTAVVTFMIDAESTLDFTEILSADFEMSYFEENGRHLYQFDVYKTGEEQTTLLELYAETTKQIPAVIIMSVDW